MGDQTLIICNADFKLKYLYPQKRYDIVKMAFDMIVSDLESKDINWDVIDDDKSKVKIDISIVYKNNGGKDGNTER